MRPTRYYQQDKGVHPSDDPPLTVPILVLTLSYTLDDLTSYNNRDPIVVAAPILRAVAGGPRTQCGASVMLGEEQMNEHAEVAVIGAGPHGLAAAANLAAAGIETRVFGEPMGFWERHMPVGMLLKSSWRSSHISDPDSAFTLDRFEDAEGQPVDRPIRVEDFVRYGRWFGDQINATLDPRFIREVRQVGSAFSLRLEDGEEFTANRVVVAAGVSPFAWRPRQFVGLPQELVSHTFDWPSLGDVPGRHITVIGAGQSALESAALLHEHGAEVELLVRAPGVNCIPSHQTPNTPVGRFVDAALYPPSEVGPRGYNWVAALPDVFSVLPPKAKRTVSKRCLEPWGAHWLPERMNGVSITSGCAVEAVTRENGGLKLSLSSGGTRTTDHVLLGTGYQVDVLRYPFLSESVKRSLHISNGHPILTRGLESSVAGLHFVGAPAAVSYGPVMRFVVGSWYSAPAVAAYISRGRIRRRRRAFK